MLLRWTFQLGKDAPATSQETFGDGWVLPRLVFPSDMKSCCSKHTQTSPCAPFSRPLSSQLRVARQLFHEAVTEQIKGTVGGAGEAAKGAGAPISSPPPNCFLACLQIQAPLNSDAALSARARRCSPARAVFFILPSDLLEEEVSDGEEGQAQGAAGSSGAGGSAGGRAKRAKRGKPGPQ